MKGRNLVIENIGCDSVSLTQISDTSKLKNMKTLPEKFAIKRAESNPLWRKYVDWLNLNYEKGRIHWSGNCWNYYGHWLENASGTDCFPDATILTLEQWDEIVNPVFNTAKLDCGYGGTLIDLSNTKIRVKNEIESRLVQEKAFELGWKWGVNDQNVCCEKEPYLYFYVNRNITHGNTPSCFAEHKHKEITLTDLNIKVMKTLKPKDAQRIIDSACSSWKPRLADTWGAHIVMGKEIAVGDDFYAEMRKACTSDQNKLFDEIFGAEKPKFNASMLEIGEAMVLDIKDGEANSGYNGQIIVRSYSSFVSLNNPRSTWSLDNKSLTGRKVKLNPITYTEL